MNEPHVTIRLDGGGRVYRPGDTLSGEYRLNSLEDDSVRAVEVSVLWYTEGKGDEDLAVHEFRRIEPEADSMEPLLAGRFSTRLPNSPLSYQGGIVNLRWCVRVRAFLERGREVMEEVPFRLGDLPPVKVLGP